MTASGAFLQQELLVHVPMHRNRWHAYQPHARQNLARFFRQLPGGQWIAGDNLRTYHVLRDLQPSLLADGSEGSVTNATQADRTWTTSI